MENRTRNTLAERITPYFVVGLYLLIILTIALTGCGKKEPDYCNQNFTYEVDQIGFMESGVFMDGDAKSYLKIVKFNDYDWSKNLYFTGSTLSANKADAMIVEAKDSCLLKNAYFSIIKIHD